MAQQLSSQYFNAEGDSVSSWPLDPSQVAVVLLVCKGILTLDEGVNVTGLPAEHLINEAEAWAVAGGNV